MMMMKVDYLEYHEIAINNSGIYKIEIRKNSIFNSNGER